MSANTLSVVDEGGIGPTAYSLGSAIFDVIGGEDTSLFSLCGNADKNKERGEKKVVLKNNKRCVLCPLYESERSDWRGWPFPRLEIC